MILLLRLFILVFIMVSCDSGTEIESCSTTLSEVEPNNGSATVPTDMTAVNYQDLSTTFEAGCKVVISGTITAGDLDYFKFNTGDVRNINITVSWSSATDAINIYIKDNFNYTLTSSTTTQTDIETLNYVISTNNFNRFLYLEGLAGANYTITMESF